MKTVREFIDENKLKPGDKVTDGTNTWVITRYMDRRTAEKYMYYLKGVDSASPLVAGSSLHIVVIPNLAKVPKRIPVYKWAYQIAGKEPEVSKHFYPDGEELAKRFHPDDDVLWVKRLDDCYQMVEVDCDC